LAWTVDHGIMRLTSLVFVGWPTAIEVEPMSELYQDDILLWSERQSELLRRLASGERVNNQVDWENVIEEVESVGREQVLAVQSLLRQSLIHMLKAEGWPLSRHAPNWRADAVRFRADAADRYAPSMRQRIDLDRIYRQALRALPATMDGQAPGAEAQVCPATLEELLAEA
jgi:hypothetical protein